MSLRTRIERLEKAAAKSRTRFPRAPEPPPAMSDEQLAETIERFLNGESLQAIAHSQGRSWNPDTRAGNPAFPEVTEDDLREGICRLLADADDDEADEPFPNDDDTGTLWCDSEE